MKKTLWILFFLLFFSTILYSQNSSTRVKHYNLGQNALAIQGYDPVSYFTDGDAKKGKKEFSVINNGITYYFRSEANKSLFLKNPAFYEPQYGGWCAYAMGAKGEKVSVDPETFKLLNGKLYLFYNSYFNNTLKSWNKDEENLKKKADQNWNKISN
jgi:YHS domain-containing protein